MPDVPAYRVKVSARAKHVRLRINTVGDVVVVVPRGFRHDLIDDMVVSRADWIEQVRAKLPLKSEVEILPTAIYLPATDEHWQVEYRQSLGPVRIQQYDDRQLRLTGKLDDTACRQALRRWLMSRARMVLQENLDNAVQRTGLDYNKLTVRGQQTRWGSCSSRGTISLNYQLLFVSPAMLEYVVHHELCHTVHMNHSPAFYRLLAGFLPGYREQERQLKQVWRELPGWLYGIRAGGL